MRVPLRRMCSHHNQRAKAHVLKHAHGRLNILGNKEIFKKINFKPYMVLIVTTCWIQVMHVRYRIIYFYFPPPLKYGKVSTFYYVIVISPLPRFY